MSQKGKSKAQLQRDLRAVRRELRSTKEELATTESLLELSREGSPAVLAKAMSDELALRGIEVAVSADEIDGDPFGDRNTLVFSKRGVELRISESNVIRFGLDAVVRALDALPADAIKPGSFNEDGMYAV